MSVVVELCDVDFGKVHEVEAVLAQAEAAGDVPGPSTLPRPHAQSARASGSSAMTPECGSLTVTFS